LPVAVSIVVERELAVDSGEVCISANVTGSVGAK
jgi:hypothetical protein